MRASHRELTEKYKSFRLPHDPLFLSRTIQTLFNKFTKQGKKATARRHIYAALTRFRLSVRRQEMYYALIRTLRRLHIQFILVYKRKGRKINEVPVPVRRNKRDVLNIQTLTTAIQRRRERALSERIQQELLALNFKRRQSATMRQRSAYMSKVYDERVNMEMRWK